MTSPEPCRNELTAPPVKLPKGPSKCGCRTAFLLKGSKHIRRVEDADIRRTQRQEFQKLMAELVDQNDSKEIAYSQSAAEALRKWLDHAQKLWNMDLTPDMECMFDVLEEQAIQYKEAKEEEKAQLKQEHEDSDAEFVLVSQEDQELYADDWVRL